MAWMHNAIEINASVIRTCKGAPDTTTAATASEVIPANKHDTQREGRYSKPMAGADVIDDRLPVGARRLGVAHDPVPQVWVLHVE